MYLLFLLGCLCQLTDSSPQDIGIYWLNFNEKPCSEVCSAANKKNVVTAGQSVCSGLKENKDLYLVGFNDELNHKNGCGIGPINPAYPSTRKCLCTDASLTTSWEHNQEVHSGDCEYSCSNAGKRAVKVNGQQDKICSFSKARSYIGSQQTSSYCQISDFPIQNFDCLCINGLKAISDTTKAPELTTVAKTVPKVTPTKNTGVLFTMSPQFETWRTTSRSVTYFTQSLIKQKSTTSAPVPTTVEVGLKATSDTTKTPELTTVAKTVPQVTTTKSTGVTFTSSPHFETWRTTSHSVTNFTQASIRQRSTKSTPVPTTVEVEVTDEFEAMHGRQWRTEPSVAILIAVLCCTFLCIYT